MKQLGRHTKQIVKETKERQTKQHTNTNIYKNTKE
jgi:hypothetical protein